MQMIRHPNIVQLLEVVETEHRLVILIYNQKGKFPINEDMLFRLVTIIYFTVLCDSLTHSLTHLCFRQNIRSALFC